MIRQIIGEEPFETLKGGFSVSASNSGYTLAYSADGRHYTLVDDATPAGEECMVICPPATVYYKLVGNTDTVTINI